MNKQRLIAGLERRLQRRQTEHARAWKLLKEAERGKYPLETFDRAQRDTLARYEECRRILNWVRAS